MWEKIESNVPVWLGPAEAQEWVTSVKKNEHQNIYKGFYDPVGKRTWNQIDDGLDSEAPFRTLG